MLSRLVRVAVAGALLFSIGFTFASRVTRAADFAVNDVVVVDTDWLNVRSNPGTDGSILLTIRQGIRLMIVDGPTDDDGYTWYKVNILGDSDEDPLTGWVAADFIATETSDGGFATARWVVVSDGPVNVRSTASLDGSVSSVQQTGSEFTVVANSDLVSADGYTWINVTTFGAVHGWIATDFLSILNEDPGQSGDDGGFAGAEGVEVIDGPVNIRQAPGLDGTVIGTLDLGAQVPVNLSLSPHLVSAGGFDWIAVLFGNGLPGYVATDFLGPLSSSPNLGSSDALSSFVDAAGAFVTDGPVNLRAEPGTSAAILLTLAEGDYVWLNQPVVENTATIDGYFWLMVDVAGETGWVAIDYISAAA